MKSIYGILFSVGLGVVGCGQSPIANHREPAQAEPLPPASLTTFSGPIASTKGSNRVARIATEQAPVVGKPYSLTINFWEKAQASENGPYSDPTGKLTASLKMPECGCVWDDVKIEKTADGTYRFTNIYFTKKGIWELHVQTKNDAALVDEFVYSFTL